MQYEVRKSARARYMRLSVHQDGAVVVTVPRIFRGGNIDHFVAMHDAWIQRALARVKGKHVIRIARADIKRLKAEALALAKGLSARYAARYGLTYGAISVRAQKTRWGSCSKKGNLSFNYKIAALPPRLAEYVAVHEVCHLAAFDHSKRFWDLVAQEVPDHKAQRAALRNITFIFY
ncbi:MAG: putative metal-dependent hydrolase [Parcubacteria group bacterium Athens0416_74]|nr:MAG: putative metal-dependent hydrolase [Parcubacteria group bacterium Athens0416_74]